MCLIFNKKELGKSIIPANQKAIFELLIIITKDTEKNYINEPGIQ